MLGDFDEGCDVPSLHRIDLQYMLGLAQNPWNHSGEFKN